MSQENVEVVRRLYEAWNREDFDAFVNLFDADAEVITDPSWMEAGPLRGRAAIRDWNVGLRESWDERDAFVLSELFEAGDRVVARGEWRVRGRKSGVEMDFDATSVNTIEGGKIVRQQWYFDHSQALEAVGLSE